VKAAVAELSKSRKGVRAEVKRDLSWLLVSTQGNAVHSSTADEGQNALWDLSAIAARLPLAKNGIAAMLSVVASRFDQDHWGEKLGIAYSDPLMGKLLVAPTMLRVKDGKVKLEVNMRRPRGKDKAQFQASLDSAARAIGEATSGKVKAEADPYLGDPHVADTTGALVTTLLGIYQRRQNAPDAKPLSIRGGTYARLFPGAVDFGPSFPGEHYTGHSPDEYIPIDGMMKTARMLGEAVHALAIDKSQGSPSGSQK